MFKIRTWCSLLILLFGLVQGGQIITVLPKLVRKQHIFPAENFTVRHKEHFKYGFSPFEMPDVSITTKKGLDAESNCVFKQQDLSIREVQSFEFGAASLDEMSLSENSMAVSYQENLIYFLTGRLRLIAFSFNATHLNRVAAHNIEVPNLPENASSGSAIVASQDGLYVFLFSPYGVWRIDCRGVLSSIQKLQTGAMSYFKFHVNDALVHGELIIVSSLANGVFAYHLDVTGSLYMVSHITKYDNQRGTLFPVSLAVDKNNSLLFILEQTDNIYVYNIVGGRLIPHDVIAFKHSENYKIRVSGEHILYSFIENLNFKICELEYNMTQKAAELIRYYKLFDYITDFFVFDHSMLVFSTQVLDWFPIGVDPRLIQKQHNGIRVHSTARKVLRISDALYLFSNGKSLQLNYVQFRPPEIDCHFDRKHTQITIKTQSNISSCSNVGLEGSHKKGKYNYYCELHKVLNIDIDVPEKNQRQKAVMYGVMLLFVVMFLLGIVCLVQWRNNRVRTIDWFNDQIRKYQQKKMMVHRALNEEPEPKGNEGNDKDQPEHQPPEIEMPEIISQAIQEPPKPPSDTNV